ncbi:MAG: Gfo/Idh/MocA family oxidoreductase [Lachnospiraceae bacterium]|nr:Gfo/Idh/MocA family oxidoreductase [Lachnospiraceae bacterium]
MKIGILGCGRIAELLAETYRAMEDVECYAVASRSPEKAEDFAKRNGFQKAYGSYEELVADPEVGLIYIATPHSRHFEDMKLCIEGKKPALCEKSFTLNAAEAEEIQKLSRENGIYVAEAIWTRYMPSRQIINDMIDSGIIGTPKMLTANLSYTIDDKPRILDPELAGGALLDVGVYGLNFALMHFGKDIESVESSVQMTDRGVDAQESITLKYQDGRMAVLTHGVYSRSDRKGIIYGTKGYIVVENINNPQSVTAFDDEDRELEHIDVPEQISGYEYEVREAMRRIAEGKTESESMPLAESVYVMELMDALRKQWGLVYPKER